MSDLTAERLRELLHYDPETGAFVWKVARTRKGVGDRAEWYQRDGYGRIHFDKRNYATHRLAWLYVHGCWPPGLIDHINGTPGDDRISNLRVADANANAMNRRKSTRNTSGYKGVSVYRRSGKWRTEIAARGVRYTVGFYDTPEAAAAAYRIAAEIIHGEFARAD